MAKTRKREDATGEGSLGDKAHVALDAVTKFFKDLGDPSDLKSKLAILLAIITTVWTLLGIQATVRELEPRVTNNLVEIERAERKAVIAERKADRAQERVDRLAEDVEELERARAQLNQIIRKAVKQGIAKGVAVALREMNDS